MVWWLSAGLPACPAMTAFYMIVHQPHGLHEGIHGRRPDKFPAAFF